MATTVNLLLSGVGPWAPPPARAVTLVLGAGGEPAPGLLVGSASAAPWGVAGPAGAHAAVAAWGAAAAAGSTDTRAPWGHNTTRVALAARVLWSAPAALALAARAPWVRAATAQVGPAAHWQRSDGAALAARAPWVRSLGAQRVVGLPWQRSGVRAASARLPWGLAGRIVAPNTRLPAPPPAAPASRVPQWVRLRFCAPLPASTALRLGVDPCAGVGPGGGTSLIPARSTYMQSHTLSAVRLPDLAVVPLTGFSLSADRDSFGWTLSASGPVSLLTQLAPSGGLPRRLRVTIDGLTWEFAVEGLRRERRFEGASASITGRSVSALLAEPYSPRQTYLNTVPMTAQQIVADALQFTGVGLDWRITDWLVPAGAWSYTGTAMGVVRAVADAVGALVQSPRTGDNVIVAPRYPLLPRDWATATPDVVLASLDAVVSEGYERADRPDYDGVYVSGQAQGVLALVKIAGSAPATLLPMVTDPLITHLDAARQRGTALLGASGPQSLMTLTLPVLTGVGEPGVIDVGKLVHVADPDGAWRGLVRSVRVTAALPGVEQTITLERHG